jgi:tRNA U54 and U55 pseudouridine synthase Pus10
MSAKDANAVAKPDTTSVNPVMFKYQFAKNDRGIVSTSLTMRGEKKFSVVDEINSTM